ncbi:MAG TPA: cation diffusion facilitator family transporter [Bacteroidales bacterium]|nr:cation diffusion facilitator family transporter [Bacteroidales bacterium]
MVKEKKRVALISVFAAIFLTSFKLVVGVITGSLGILSEALHSGLDLIAAVITYFSVRISDKPPDKEHNYGHGKIENFSAFIETILLLITCTWIIYEAVQRLVTGQTHIEVNSWSYVVVGSSMIIDFTRSRALYKVAKAHNSQALEADALHFSTDIWSSGVVLFGLICANVGFFFADSVAALCVAVIVLFVSYKLGKKAVDVLLDKAPQEIVLKVQQVLKKYDEVKYFHSLKVRSAGADTFIKFNIHVDPDLSIRSIHELCDKIEKELNSIIPRSEVYIHAEPQDMQHIDKEEFDSECVF